MSGRIGPARLLPGPRAPALGTAFRGGGAKMEGSSGPGELGFLKTRYMTDICFNIFHGFVSA